MAGRDGRGPFGQGALTGRGLGFCASENVGRSFAGYGLGYGPGRGRARSCGFGFGRNFGYNQIDNRSAKEILTEEKQLLEDRLNNIFEQLEDL